MSAPGRQFGKSSFRPSFGGVGTVASGDEENMNNAIIDDDGELENLPTKARTSAAFLNATLATKANDNALEQPVSASSARSSEDMEVEVEETDPSEEPIPASALDQVLDSDHSDDDEDNQEQMPLSATDDVEPKSSAASEKVFDSDSDSDDDMVGASQVTSSQKTIDELMSDSSDDDDIPPIRSHSQTQSQGATQSQTQTQSRAGPALGQLDDTIFDDGEGDDDVSLPDAKQESTAPNFDAVNTGMDVEGADLNDDDSLNEEIQMSQAAQDMPLEDSDEEGGASQHEKSKKKKLKKASKLSESPERNVPKKSVVDQEIEASKAMDEGPSEEDLQRRAVYKVDQDEIDRKADAINKEMWAMMQKSLLGADEQRVQLQEIRKWFQSKRAVQDEELQDYIRDELTAALKVIRGAEGERYYASLEQFLARAEDADDSDEDYVAEEEEEGEEEQPGEGTEVEIIEFSESDDDESDNEVGERDEAAVEKEDFTTLSQKIDVTEASLNKIDLSTISTAAPDSLSMSTDKVDIVASQAAEPVMHVTETQTAPHRVTPDEKTTRLSKKTLKQRFALASRGLKQKGNLKRELKKQQKAKIDSIAIQSYNRIFCRKIDLTLQKEITSKCRALGDLFFQRVERKLAVKRMREAARRERLRREYQAQADDDEGELDDEVDGEAGGRFNVGEMTEEEQLEAQQRFIEEGMRLQEEADEEEEAAAAAAEQDYVVEEGADENADADSMEGAVASDELEGVVVPSTGETEEAEEDEEVVLARQIAKKKSFAVEDNNDEEGTETQTQTPVPIGGGLEGEEELLSDDEADVVAHRHREQEAALAAAKARAKKAGKSLYQMQVEEEERRAKNEKRGGLFDTEAEEEEETGMQAGLEDFGFGTSKQREGDEERDALKMRKDDFKGIADDLSDDEKEGRDEDAAARFRAKQQELDDMIASKRIIKGDLTKRNKSKGLLSEDFLAGGESHVFDPEADVDDQIEAIDQKLKEYSEEELLQSIQEEKRQKELAMALARGESDSEGEADSDDDDDENDPDEAFMTEAQKSAYRHEKARMKELKQKAKIQEAEFKALARTRRFLRQESIRKSKQELMRQNSTQSEAGSGAPAPLAAPTAGASTSMPGPPALKRSLSAAMGPSKNPNNALSRQNSTKSPRGDATGSMAMPGLQRARSFGSEGKNNLVRQPTFNGGGELGSEKLTFKRQRSQLALSKAGGTTNSLVAASTNMGAARNFMFRNNSTSANLGGMSRSESQSFSNAPSGASSSSSFAEASGGNSLRRKGSLYNALKK